MADLPEVGEELLRVIPEEQLRHIGVLQAPGPHNRRHGQRLVSEENTHRVSVCYLEGSPMFVLETQADRNMVTHLPMHVIALYYYYYVCLCCYLDKVNVLKCLTCSAQKSL